MSDLTDSTEVTAHVTGSTENATEVSANDPATLTTYTSPSIPNTYAAQPTAGVTVVWGVIAKLNSPGTSTISDTIICKTTLSNYTTDVPNAVAQVYSLFNAWTAATPGGLNADCEIHWSISLSNPTAPSPAMGVVPLAKQHLDGHLSAGNIASSSDILTPIMNNIPFLQSIAKY